MTAMPAGPCASPIRPTEVAQPATVQVSFLGARRPEEATHVRLETFDGPLALLLALIEQRRLDVLTVRLGDLAGAYLEAVARLEDGGRLPLLSSFVGVCSQLILIKSRAMLPRAPQIDVDGEAEAADPEEELRRRLIVYRRYRDASRVLAARLEAGLALFRREPATASAEAIAGAQPPARPPLEVQLLIDALAASARLVPPPPPPAETVGRIVTLEERAAVIRGALREAPAVVLQELLRDVSDRVVVAVTFLALLELVKGRELTVEQREPWGPIEVRRINDARH
jgi:segregation and condensation protein A